MAVVLVWLGFEKQFSPWHSWLDELCTECAYVVVDGNGDIYSPITAFNLSSIAAMRWSLCPILYLESFFNFKQKTKFLKLRIQQHSTTAEVRRVSEFPFAIGSRSIVYVCAQQRAKNVSKYSNILMPSRASSSYFFPLGCSWCYYFQGVD